MTKRLHGGLNRSKSLAALAALGVMLPLQAQAADPAGIGKRPVYAAAMNPARARDWSGAYLGIHGGLASSGFRSSSAAPNIPALNFPDRRNTRGLSGGMAGLQAGYNFQSGNLVYGVEGEASLLMLNRKKSATGLSAEQGSRFALKGRLGYSLGSTLIYGTMGVAMAPTRLTSPAAGGFAASRKNIVRSGLIVGLGAEQMLTQSISLKGELDYTYFGQSRQRFTAGSTKIDNGILAAKVGLNYRF